MIAQKDIDVMYKQIEKYQLEIFQCHRIFSLFSEDINHRIADNKEMFELKCYEAIKRNRYLRGFRKIEDQQDA